MSATQTSHRWVNSGSDRSAATTLPAVAKCFVESDIEVRGRCMSHRAEMLGDRWLTERRGGIRNFWAGGCVSA